MYSDYNAFESNSYEDESFLTFLDNLQEKYPQFSIIAQEHNLPLEIVSFMFATVKNIIPGIPPKSFADKFSNYINIQPIPGGVKCNIYAKNIKNVPILITKLQNLEYENSHDMFSGIYSETAPEPSKPSFRWSEYVEIEDIKKHFPKNPSSNDILELYEFSKNHPELKDFLIKQSTKIKV